jgi:hypothetical protein
MSKKVESNEVKPKKVVKSKNADGTDKPKRPPSEWVLFLKEQSQKLGIKYGEAMTDPRVKKSWAKLKLKKSKVNK